MTAIVQVYYVQAPDGDAEWYAGCAETLAALDAEDAPVVCFHANPRPKDFEWLDHDPINLAISAAVARATTLARNRVLRSLNGYVIALALLVLSASPLVSRFVFAEARGVAQVALIAQALLCAVGAGKALEIWRGLRKESLLRRWLTWPHYATFRVGAPPLARAGGVKAKPAGAALLIALLLVALGHVVIVPPQHVAMLSDGTLVRAPVSAHAGQWELYQIEWEGTFVVPLVDAGENAVWVYVVSYHATAGPGDVAQGWPEWAEGVAQRLVSRVLNEMYQGRDPDLPEEAWKTVASEAFREAEMVAAFEDVIRAQIEEVYGEKIELGQLEVCCERWTIAQYMKEVG
jgi:hypothetical protein